ncbi:MAG: hypothetical protein ACREYD_07295 [Casimicrobiaceae bacterium]
MSEELRLKVELRAASVLLRALVARQADPDDVRSVFESAVVRETAHMLERGVRSDIIRAFEAAVGAWAVRSRMMLRQRGREIRGATLQRRVADRRQRRQTP